MRHVAGFFPATEYPQVLVGLGEPDDAAVFRLDDARALIATTDFFTPIVDDPWTYGAIAAANAMSDVYAMGGDVLFCLNMAGFPDGLDGEIVAQIFSGGAYKVPRGRRSHHRRPYGHQSGTLLRAECHRHCPSRSHHDQARRASRRYALSHQAHRHRLITTAAKLAGAGESVAHRLARRATGKPPLDVRHLDTAVQSMLLLNRTAAAIAQLCDVKGATDITGFGLLGHGSEMAVAAGSKHGAGLRIRAAEVPLLPGALDYARAGYLTRGSSRNPATFGEHVRFADSVPADLRTVLWEVETSGGLLLAVPADQARALSATSAGRGNRLAGPSARWWRKQVLTSYNRRDTG